MKTLVIRIGPDGEVPRRTLEDLCGILLDAGVLAYPTETFYGLGAAGFSRKGVERVFRLKNRAGDKPLPVMASDLDMVREIAAGIPRAFSLLAGEFWPGPLTLVLRAAPALPVWLTGPDRTVAVRIPPASWVRKIVGTISQPLTATSANLSGMMEVDNAAEVIRCFGGKIAAVIDGGKTPGGAPSTILDLTRDTPVILREGQIPAADVLAVLGLPR